MSKNDAELMRRMMDVTVEQQSQLNEASLTDIGKGLAAGAKWAGQKLGDVIGTAAGQGRVERKTLYNNILSLFKASMGRSGQDWNTLTWRTLLNFMINKNVVSQLGISSSDALTTNEVMEIIKDPKLRSKLNAPIRRLSDVMPVNILSVKNDPIVTKMGPLAQDKTKQVQIIVSSLLAEMTSALMEKTTGGDQFGGAPATADDVISLIAADVNTTPDKLKNHLRNKYNLNIAESRVDVKTPILEYLKKTMHESRK